MKKTYFAPELTTQFIQTEGLIALSLQSGTADNSDALVKGQGDWDIFGCDDAATEEADYDF